MEKLNLGSTNRSERKRLVWTPLNVARRNDVKLVLYSLSEYWPLTLRGLFYQLIQSYLLEAAHWYKKNGAMVEVYQTLKRLMKWMRFDGIVPVYSITDQHRILTEKRGYDDMSDFVNRNMGFSFQQYDRCLAQDQPRYIEVWVEKAALLHLVEPVADEFCRRVVVARGYDSISFQINFYRRATKAISAGQIPTVLYFGDWDPSGVNMIYAAMQTLREEMLLSGVEYYRCGILPQHFEGLHKKPVPLKESDPRTKKFRRLYGDTAYELDALHPKKLQSLVRESITKKTDMKILKQNQIIESKELGPSYEMDGVLQEAKGHIRELIQ